MSETKQALIIAERVLDRPYADPDDDLAILARQTKRAAELRAERDAMAKQVAELGGALVRIEMATVGMDNCGCCIAVLDIARRALERGTK